MTIKLKNISVKRLEYLRREIPIRMTENQSTILDLLSNIREDGTRLMNNSINPHGTVHGKPLVFTLVR